GIVPHALMGERRSHQPAPLTMQVAFARQQPIAKNGPRDHPEHWPLDEIVGPFNQDFGRQFRRIHQHHFEAPEVHSADARNLRAQLFHHAKALPENDLENANDVHEARVAPPPYFSSSVMKSIASLFFDMPPSRCTM